MREVVLFIAMSLDGFIADTDGSVGWLCGQGSEEEGEDAYSEFIKDVDTVVMGWKTYHQVASELSPSEWVYSDLASYVITHRSQVSTENIQFVSESPSSLVRRLKEQDGKRIWICGGADIVRQVMADGLIDRFHISVIPTILGGGVRLFGASESEYRLRLVSARNYNGIVEAIYESRDVKNAGSL